MSAHTETIQRPARGAPTATPASPGSNGELWLFTLDHRRLALMHAIVIGLALVAGVFLAAGLSIQPVAGRGAGVDAESFRHVYSMHGLALTFLVALPAIPTVIGNWLLPERVGVESMAWPRLNLLSFHLLATSALLFVVAFLAAPVDTGWSFDAPFSVTSSSNVAWSALAIVCAALSFACGGANTLATLIASRFGGGGGRAWSQLPLSAWAFGASALVQTLAAPVLVIAMTLLLAQRAGASDWLGATSAAADVTFASWFWAWGHAALSAMALAIVGIISEVVEAHSGGADRAPGRAAIVSVISLAVCSFAGSGVHALGRGASGPSAASVADSALVLLAGTPLGVLVALWVAALARRTRPASAALAYALSALVCLVTGALAGVFLAMLPTGVYLQNTTFATGQLHFVALGGTLCAFLAGVHHLWPRWFGVAARESWGFGSCLLVFAGLNLAFLPQLVLGYLGEPRRSASLLTGPAWLAIVSAIGAALVLCGLLFAGWNLLASVAQKRAASAAERVA